MGWRGVLYISSGSCQACFPCLLLAHFRSLKSLKYQAANQDHGRNSYVLVHYKGMHILCSSQLQTSGLTLWQIVVNLLHCIPIQAYWDKTISGNCPINDKDYFVGSVLAHLLMDFVILGLPAPYINKLQISLYQKFCLFAMFLLGGL